MADNRFSDIAGMGKSDQPSIIGAIRDPQFVRDVMGGLRDTTGRGVASALGAPVDLMTLGMRVYGYQVPDENVVGGSEWIGKKMQDAGIISKARNQIAEMLGGLAMPTPVAAGKAMAAIPVVGRMMREAPRDEALRIAQANAAKPVSEGGLGLAADNTAMDRARAMGFDVPAYHGTGENFNNIDLSKAGQASGGNVKAFFTAKEPELAGDYLPMELVPKPEYANVYRNQERYQKAILSKYGDFSKQSDLFMKKPDISESWQIDSTLRNNPEVSKAFESYLANPEFVAGYAKNRQSVKNLVNDLEKDRPKMHTEQYVSGANTMPMMVQKNNFVDFDAKGQAWTPELDRQIQQMLNEQGLSGVVGGVNIRNIYDGKAGRVGNTQMIFDPSEVRSRFAAFDPAKRYESDLLGSADPRLLGAMGLGTGATLYGISRMGQDKEKK